LDKEKKKIIRKKKGKKRKALKNGYIPPMELMNGIDLHLQM